MHNWEKPILLEAASYTLQQKIHLERIQDALFPSNKGNLLCAQK